MKLELHCSRCSVFELTSVIYITPSCTYCVYKSKKTFFAYDNIVIKRDNERRVIHVVMCALNNCATRNTDRKRPIKYCLSTVKRVAV